ncbi:UNVERIFIED_ORG: K+-sensing histidine kinase KdpD [Bradyrhizobium japonicum]
MTTIYRNYDVSKLGDTFVGQSRDDESLMISRSQQRLMSAIDQMWDGLDRGCAPSWFSGSSAIDLDAVEIVDEKDGPEAIPSETDPPPAKEWRVPYWAFGLAALGVSAPVAYAMDFLQIDARIDVMLTLGICAVALAFGRGYALMCAGISGFIVNFFAVEPFFTFDPPTWSEVANLAINFAAAWAIPMLLKEGSTFRRSKG